MTEEERINKFIEELTKISLRYNIEIGGCGCCGSPYLENISGDKLSLDYRELKFDYDNMKYKIRK